MIFSQLLTRYRPNFSVCERHFSSEECPLCQLYEADRAWQLHGRRQARPGYFGQSTRIRDGVRRIHVHQMSSNKKVGSLLPTFAALVPCSCPNRMRHFSRCQGMASDAARGRFNAPLRTTLLEVAPILKPMRYAKIDAKGGRIRGRGARASDPPEERIDVFIGCESC